MTLEESPHIIVGQSSEHQSNTVREAPTATNTATGTSVNSTRLLSASAPAFQPDSETISNSTSHVGSSSNAIGVSLGNQVKRRGRNGDRVAAGSQNSSRQHSRAATGVGPVIQDDDASSTRQSQRSKPKKKVSKGKQPCEGQNDAAIEDNDHRPQSQARRRRNNNANTNTNSARNGNSGSNSSTYSGRCNSSNGADGKNSARTAGGSYNQRNGKMRASTAVGGGRMFDGSLTHDHGISEENDENGGGTLVQGLGRHSHSAGSTESSMPLGLGTTLAKRLANSTYECMICCDKVRPRHATWHCDNCWAIFHIGCVKKWVKSCSDSTSARWRCPGCQHERAAAPSHYVCFCGATREPEFARGTVPHSCGKVCGRNRGTYCPHACPLPCHPGPCPPCTAMAPEQFCFCGRSSYQPRCGAGYDPVDGVRSCGTVCGETLGCGKHKCEQPCHPGLCQSCPNKEDQICYCGKQTRTASCGSGVAMETFASRGKTAEKSSGEPCSAERTVGLYSCRDACSELLNCGVHRCQQLCHPHRDPALGHGECPLDPQTATTCHCGKSAAVDLGLARTKCTDPVPSCGRRCQKQLDGCLHQCKEPCHAGPCPPCKELVKTHCRCGAESFSVDCHKTLSSGNERPVCQRMCSKKRACRRHQCSQRCCPSAHQDIDGVVVPSENIAPGTTDPHQCTFVCGRLLRCKMHQCAELCHRGPCPPCRNTSFDELSCACGRTRLLPPIACGTALPSCHYPCQRTRACGHINLTAHECHPDDAPCPPCPVLVTVRCMCGGKEMKSVPCHRSSAASCGGICSKLLPCGGHRCQRSCHRPDEPCLRDQACRQACGKPRKTCGHPCALPCHSPAMCDESEPCKTLVTVSCGCGRLTAEDTCGSTATTLRSASSSINKRLACNEVCKIAMRNRRLAQAFGLKEEADTPLSGLVRATYTDDMLQFTRANLGWVREIEGIVASFIGDSRKQTLRFAPMKRALRGFLHVLGPFYGCNSRSMDREPLRSVSWDRTSHATIPSIPLSAAIRYTQPPQIICSERIHKDEDSDLDDSASHIFDGYGPGTNAAAERLRKKIDYIAISDLRHGLTCDELTDDIRKVIPHATPFVLRWKAEDLVEMYCKEVDSRNEHLVKWEAVLKTKLPHLGVAGSVVGKKSTTASVAPTPMVSPGSSVVLQPPPPPHQRPHAGDAACSKGNNPLAVESESIAPVVMPSVEHDSVPDDWESINIHDDDDDDSEDDQNSKSQNCNSCNGSEYTSNMALTNVQKQKQQQ